jgi:hypothetical protein
MEKDALTQLAGKVVEDHRKMRIFQLRQFLKHKSAVLAFIILLITIFAALLGPAVAPYPEQGLGEVNVAERLQFPSPNIILERMCMEEISLVG